MNAALNRIADRVEADRPLATNREHVTITRNSTIYGHDLLFRDIKRVIQEHGNDIERLSAEEAPEESRGIIDAAREFREQYLRLRSENPSRKVLVAVEANGDAAALYLELLHAAFFTSQEYRNTVEFFWRDLDEALRVEILTRLQTTGLDITNDTLVVNFMETSQLLQSQSTSRACSH